MTSPGKQVGSRRYISADLMHSLPEEERALVERSVAKLPNETRYNVLRVDAERNEVAFLCYPQLGDSPFPSLAESWRVHLPTDLVARRSYANSTNPPILHRTELLLDGKHPKQQAFRQLSRTCEELGFFEDTSIIGFQKNWERVVATKGFKIVGVEVHPLGNADHDCPDSPDETTLPSHELRIERHRTAISRTGISAPVQCLLRDGLLSLDSTFFDYGCGKGDDLAALTANGFAAAGWDPFFRPDAARMPAAVVNLGFVINVIEDFDERLEALTKAFALSERVLAVSAMLSSSEVTKYAAYKDGVVTRRSTFQKYFTQAELQQFIESTLGEDAYGAAPGIFYVFRDRNLEQQYLLRKVRGGSRSVPTIRYAPRTTTVDTSGPPRRIARTQAVSESAEDLELLSRLWSLTLERGREPAVDEIPFLDKINSRFRSLRSALAKCRQKFLASELESAGSQRRADLLVLLALRKFERRRQFQSLEPSVARDIRHFFGSLREAEFEARDLLFSIQNQELILESCRAASVEGLGYFEDSRALHLHTGLVGQLPSVLRVYVGCASALAGDLASYDVAKIHVLSGKVTLLKYDDFEGRPLPALQRRVKVRFHDQQTDNFEYGAEFPSTLLFQKSLYINEDFPRYSEQIAFEEALRDAKLDDESEHGPTVEAYRARLRAARYRIKDFTLARSDDIPSLDEWCGKTFRYRDLIECGETWNLTHVDNTPREPATFNALCDLARNVIDPVIDYYGSVKLTYGFASASLTRLIKGRIAPRLDQHASCEVVRGGRNICDRLGAAVDFIVEYEDMYEVAKWIAANCDYDRIYIYGKDRPIHVSIGPQNSRDVYELVDGKRGKVPRRVAFDGQD